MSDIVQLQNGTVIVTDEWYGGMDHFKRKLQPEAASDPPYQFRQCGDYWNVCFDGVKKTIEHAAGMSFIYELLSKPDTPIFANELYVLGKKRLLGKIACEKSIATKTDDQTIRELSVKYRQLQTELNHALEINDSLLADEIRSDMAVIDDYCRKNIGRHQQLRKENNKNDTMRQSVLKAIQRSLSKILKELPTCGEYLRPTIKTGQILMYTHALNVSWML